MGTTPKPKVCSTGSIKKGGKDKQDSNNANSKNATSSGSTTRGWEKTGRKTEQKPEAASDADDNKVKSSDGAVSDGDVSPENMSVWGNKKKSFLDVAKVASPKD